MAVPTRWPGPSGRAARHDALSLAPTMRRREVAVRLWSKVARVAMRGGMLKLRSPGPYAEATYRACSHQRRRTIPVEVQATYWRATELLLKKS